MHTCEEQGSRDVRARQRFGPIWTPMLEASRCGLCYRCGEIGRCTRLELLSDDGCEFPVEAIRRDSQILVGERKSETRISGAAVVVTNPCTNPNRQQRQPHRQHSHLVTRFLEYANSAMVCPRAAVAESAYAQDLKSWGSQGRVGSSPTSRTTKEPATVVGTTLLSSSESSDLTPQHR